jgi:hypothetical protein
MGDTDTETRAGLNEGIFREVNERIAELGEVPHLVEAEFVCECADASCNEQVRLSQAEYEAVRAEPVRFFVVPGHERAGIDRVVEAHEHYLVVDKRGEAGAVAEETDPRSE